MHSKGQEALAGFGSRKLEYISKFHRDQSKPKKGTVAGNARSALDIYIYIYIRRPLVEGPPGCEEYELDCILYPSILSSCILVFSSFVSLVLHPCIFILIFLYLVGCMLYRVVSGHTG